MVTLKQSLVLMVCLIQLPYFSSAFFKSSRSRKRSGKSSRINSVGIRHDIMFKNTLAPVTLGARHGSLMLECQAQAIPAVTVHWLKDGVRILQGYSNNIEDDAATYEESPENAGLPSFSLSVTKSRLFLDCLNSADAATYTCVAETPFTKITQNTTVKVVKRDFDIFNEVSECQVKKSRRVEPARIFMWSSSRLHYEGLDVQLFCRAQGHPEPTVTWYDKDNNKLVNDGVYEYLENGDLVIKSITWMKHMGTYTCFADNGVDADSKDVFLYPVGRDIK